MHPTEVTFVFPAPAPTDWASTLCLLPIAEQWAKTWRMSDIAISRLMYTHDRHAKEQTGKYPECGKPHPFNENGCIAVLIEGKAEKE